MFKKKERFFMTATLPQTYCAILYTILDLFFRLQFSKKVDFLGVGVPASLPTMEIENIDIGPSLVQPRPPSLVWPKKNCLPFSNRPKILEIFFFFFFLIFNFAFLNKIV